MESKHKNVLIVALLAVVLVMAVGYAALSQTLTINSKATIDQGSAEDPNWKVAFDKSKTTEVRETAGATGSTPEGTINFTDDYNATITAEFDAPGDTIVYTFTVQNYGNIKASLSAPTISLQGGEDSDPSDTVVKNNNMTFTVSPLGGSSSLAADATTTFTVTAVLDSTADLSGLSEANNSASIQVSFTAQQSN